MSSCVSVIIPVYKVEKYLERCVNSVLNQTYENIEIILVDDGSPDNCPALCDEIAAKNNRVSVVHKENGGLSSARLAGFEVASGTFVLFVDSDDYIANNMIEKLVNAIEQNNADLAICGYTTVVGQQSTTKLLDYQESLIDGKENVRDNYILPLIGRSYNKINIPGFIWIRLFKRSLIQKEFFVSERTYYKEDHIFDLLYGDYIRRIAVVNEALYYYCFNENSLTNVYRENKWEMYKNLFDFNAKYLSERNIEVPERLTSFLIGSLFSSVDNALLTGSYSGYRIEIKKICDDSLAKRVINSKLDNVSKSHRLTMLLLRCRMYRLLYWIRKKRLGV